MNAGKKIFTEKCLEERVEQNTQTHVPQRSKFSEKAHDWYVALAGNRITLVGGLSFLNLLTLVFSGKESSSYSVTYSAVSCLAGVLLSPLIGATLCGSNTIKFYHKTKEHIKQFGALDERFAKKIIMVDNENTDFYGYCQQQGMYLAALHYGQVKSFREFQKKYSNVKIPFF
ncbi:hypothetical protein HYX13_05345 [Candidatus Woesearchaeota archaeon]|nr:hypothetical protein [Candidatus Woesearchaeota archaeon]